MEVPERIESAGGTRLILRWPGGRVAEIGAAVLRAACPCAACAEPSGRFRMGAALASAMVRIGEVRAVGGYAIAVTFEPDGHDTGIFPYPLLARLGEQSDRAT